MNVLYYYNLAVHKFGIHNCYNQWLINVDINNYMSNH